MTNKHIGSDFDDFLAAEGILEEAEAVAKKRVFAFQLEQKRQALNLQKQALAKRMGTSRAQVDRILDPENDSLTFKSMVKAASALGLELNISLEQAKAERTSKSSSSTSLTKAGGRKRAKQTSAAKKQPADKKARSKKTRSRV